MDKLFLFDTVHRALYAVTLYCFMNIEFCIAILFHVNMITIYWHPNLT